MCRFAPDKAYGYLIACDSLQVCIINVGMRSFNDWAERRLFISSSITIQSFIIAVPCMFICKLSSPLQETPLGSNIATFQLWRKFGFVQNPYVPALAVIQHLRDFMPNCCGSTFLGRASSDGGGNLKARCGDIKAFSHLLK